MSTKLESILKLDSGDRLKLHQSLPTSSAVLRDTLTALIDKLYSNQQGSHNRHLKILYQLSIPLFSARSFEIAKRALVLLITHARLDGWDSIYCLRIISNIVQ
jgi:hypothetical protein